MKPSRVPLIFAIVLLLLPALYVGSYLALVNPSSDWENLIVGSRTPPERYRFGARWSERFFWPLEKIDRQLRPGIWGEFERIQFGLRVAMLRRESVK